METYRLAGLSTTLSGLLLLGPVLGPGALAQPPGPAEGGPVELPQLEVTGVGVPPQATIGNLPPTFPGGEVARGGRVGLLGNRSIFDTPFSQTSFTSELLRNQQSRAIADIILNDPSVQLATPRGGPQDQFVIRGFRTFQQDILFDGLGGIVGQRRPALDNIERVEILRGPTAMLNGITVNGNVGGLITLVPKRATDEPITRYGFGYASEAEFSNSIDVGRRFGANNQWGIRFNGTYRDGRGIIDNSSLRYGFAGLGLDYRGERLRVTADFGYQYEKNFSFQQLLFVQPGFAIPRAPRPGVNANQPWTFGDNEHVFGATRVEFDVTDNVTVYGAYGRSNNKDTRFVSGSPTIINTRGDLLQNGVFYEPFDVTSFGWDVGVRARLETGPIRHQLVVSAAAVERNIDFFSNRLPLVVTSNIYDPVIVPRPDTSAVRTTPGPNALNRNRGIAVANIMSALDERIIVILGGRYQEVLNRSFSITPGPSFGRQTAYYNESAFTPSVGVVVKPLERLSLYWSYIEGLQAGPTAPVTAVNAGQVFAPFVARQFEIGAKYDFGAFGASAALFQINRPSAFTDPVTRRFGVDGEQRNRGIELNVFGEVAPGVRLIGGVAAIDATLTRTADGALDGKTAPGVPDVQLSLYGEYDMPPSLLPGATLTGRVLHSGAQFYDQANTQSIPAWTRFDIGARVAIPNRFGNPVVIRGVVENVANNAFWQTAIDGLLSQGAGRTVLVSTQFSF